MMRWLITLIVLITLVVGVFIWADYCVQKSEASAVMVSLGDKTCAVKAGECAVIPLADGGCIYIVRTSKPLQVKNAGVIGE